MSHRPDWIWRSRRDAARSAKRKRTLAFRPKIDELERLQLLSFLVTNTNSSGSGSLAQAISDANSNGGGTINFAIPGTGIQTISASSLGTIGNSIAIDGTSQTGYGGSPLIEINGTLSFSASHVSLIGLYVTGGTNGIVATNSSYVTIASDVISGTGIGISFVNSSYGNIYGNSIGTNLAGTAAAANSSDGIRLSGGSSHNTIGGTTAAAANVASGNGGAGIRLTGSNTSLNLVEGNLIGTNAAGTAAIANLFGVEIDAGASTNTIGGLVSSAPSNVVSGNTNAGILVTGASSNVIVGNYVGPTAAGTATLSNTSGIRLTAGASNNTVGGTAAGVGNVVSGNYFDVRLDTTGTTANLVAGNLIGTNPAGTGILASDNTGIYVLPGASDNTIGGTTTAARNVIAGAGTGIYLGESGTTGDFVEGNYIGTDKNGSVALPNSYGISVSTGVSSVIIGGTTAGAANLISGNTTAGIYIANASANSVQGNLIGTDATGSLALPNGAGVELLGAASNNTIGGTAASARNIISGNTSVGIYLTSTGTTGNLIQGNYVGPTAAGTAALSDNNGIRITGGAFQNTVGGTAAGAGNVVSGNYFDVRLDSAGTAANVVQGNLIGTNPAGTAALSTNNTGVYLPGGATDNTIGGTAQGAGNVISGAGTGIFLGFSGTARNVVQGNLVGTDVSGSHAIPNGVGIQLYSSTSNNTIGGTIAAARNVISGNTTYGIDFSSAGTSGDVVQGNYIGTDKTGSVALANQYGVYINTGTTGVVIGGTTSGTANVISGNSAAGVYITGASGDAVMGNLIGTDASGSLAVPNLYGVELIAAAASNTIGGTATGAGNVISGNSTAGIYLTGTGTSSNLIQANLVGTNASATGAVANAYGVEIAGSATANTVGGTIAGAGNVIADNSGNGVVIGSSSADSSTTGNSILSNAIYGNGGLGIDLGNNGVTANTAGGPHTGPNRLQNTPVLSFATSGPGGTEIVGSLNSTPSAAFRIEFFANAAADPSGHGEGQTYLGSASVTTDASGNVSFTVHLPPSVAIGQLVTATSTDPAGNTSEFSSDLAVTAFMVTNTNNSGSGSLAQAISDANANGTGTIDFAIPGTGIQTISASSLGTIGYGIAIDGTSQTGYAGSPLIEISGTLSLSASYVSLIGLYFTGGANGIVASNDSYVTIAKNVISGTGIGLSLVNSSYDTIYGDLIGTNFAGTAAAANSTDGIQLSGGSSHNTIGGTTAAAANVLSGNSGAGVHLTGSTTIANVVEGNFIGTNAAGTGAIANYYGVEIDAGASGNTIGAVTTAAASNVISGNTNTGIYVSGSGTSSNVIEGNYVGTNAAGTAALANSAYGVFISNGSNNTIGGTAAGARNVISGNSSRGIYLLGSPATGNVIAGNYVGTDTTGTFGLGNGYGIALYSPNNTVGGTTAAARNVISGNFYAGVYSGGTTTAGNLIEGNYIGTDPTGTHANPNSIGVRLAYGANGVIVGGTAAGAGNLISGNSYGLQLDQTTTTGNVALGNYIGTNAAGTAALPNTVYGVYIFSGAAGNTIGGTAPGARNVISGNTSAGVYISDANTTGEVIEGNYIGTDAAGAIALSHGSGIYITSGAANIIVGGTTPGSGNLISGNYVGLELYGTSGNTVAGNYIGTNSSGTGAVPNTYKGVVIVAGASNNTIGGTVAGARNVISGNTNIGVYLGDSGTIQNVVAGNFIGVDSSGSVALPNAWGVQVYGPAANNTIGGMTTAARNIIGGNTTAGVYFSGAGTPSDLVAGNYVGTDVTGTLALPNAIGVFIAYGATGVMVGGTTTGAGNVISGNGVGLELYQTGTTGNQVQGNSIGTNAAGTAALPNTSYGIFISSGATSNTIGGTATGAGNVISGNAGDGIKISLAGTSTNVIQGNEIGTDITGSFAIPNASNGITLLSGAANDVIGGTDAGARNIISGNLSAGVYLANSATANNLVAGNLIGTDATGTLAIGNLYGVQISGSGSGNTIGGSAAASRNVISGNKSNGVSITGTGVTGTIVSGNYIGTDVSGQIALGNAGSGVYVASGASNVTIGGTTTAAGNVVAFNGASGITVGSSTSDTTTTGDSILGNSTFANGALGIDLANDGLTGNIAGGTHTGPNQQLNAPVIFSAITSSGTMSVIGSLTSAPSSTFRIELYSSPSADGAGYGEGQTYLSALSVTTDSSGNATFTDNLVTAVAVGQVLTATSTDASGNTSEFSNTVTVANPSSVAEQAPAAVDDSYTIGHDRTLSASAGIGAATSGTVFNDVDAAGNALTASLVTTTQHGTLTLRSNGSFTYVPAAHYVGTDSFTYKDFDGTLFGNVATVTINVVETAPVATNDLFSVAHDQTLVISPTGFGASGVLFNDSDAENDSLIATLGPLTPQHGSLTFNADGTFTYTPAAHYVGTDSFTYTVSDGLQTSPAATVTINVVETAPVASNDSYSIGHDHTLALTVAGVQINDTDAEGDALTTNLVMGVSHGTLTLNADGTFTYVPAAHFVGTDSFTYTDNDGLQTSNVATVSIAVTENAPVAATGTYAAMPGQALTVAADSGVLNNALDVDGDALTAAVVASVTHGSLTLNADGSFTYTPTAGFTGTDSFTFQASDGVLASAAATVTLNVTSTAVVAVDDPFAIAAGQTLTATSSVTVNDTDANGNDLTAVLVSNVAHGTLTFQSDGTFTYVPSSGFTGTDTFTYDDTDGTQTSNVATVTITVGSQPQAVVDTYTVTPGQTLTTTTANSVLVNDIDPNGLTLAAALDSSVAHGTLTLNSNGTFTYSPTSGYTGIDSFTYHASNGTQTSNTTTVTITVAGQPESVDDTYNIAPGGALTTSASNGVLANDTDSDNQPLTATLVTGPTEGDLTLNADGSFTYTPKAGFIGTDSFTYKAVEGSQSSSVATVTITVANVPTAVGDSYSVVSGQTLVTSLTQSVQANDANPGGGLLTSSVVTDVQHGSLSLQASGVFTYVPNPGFTGSDTFTYQDSNGLRDSNTVSVTISVTAEPTATPATPTLTSGTNGPAVAGLVPYGPSAYGPSSANTATTTNTAVPDAFGQGFAGLGSTAPASPSAADQATGFHGAGSLAASPTAPIFHGAGSTAAVGAIPINANPAAIPASGLNPAQSGNYGVGSYGVGGMGGSALCQFGWGPTIVATIGTSIGGQGGPAGINGVQAITNFSWISGSSGSPWSISSSPPPFTTGAGTSRVIVGQSSYSYSGDGASNISESGNWTQTTTLTNFQESGGTYSGSYTLTVTWSASSSDAGQTYSFQETDFCSGSFTGVSQVTTSGNGSTTQTTSTGSITLSGTHQSSGLAPQTFNSSFSDSVQSSYTRTSSGTNVTSAGTSSFSNSESSSGQYSDSGSTSTVTHTLGGGGYSTDVSSYLGHSDSGADTSTAWQDTSDTFSASGDSGTEDNTNSTSMTDQFADFWSNTLSGTNQSPTATYSLSHSDSGTNSSASSDSGTDSFQTASGSGTESFNSGRSAASTFSDLYTSLNTSIAFGSQTTNITATHSDSGTTGDTNSLAGSDSFAGSGSAVGGTSSDTGVEQFLQQYASALAYKDQDSAQSVSVAFGSSSVSINDSHTDSGSNSAEFDDAGNDANSANWSQASSGENDSSTGSETFFQRTKSGDQFSHSSSYNSNSPTGILGTVISTDSISDSGTATEQYGSQDTGGFVITTNNVGIGEIDKTQGATAHAENASSTVNFGDQSSTVATTAGGATTTIQNSSHLDTGTDSDGSKLALNDTDADTVVTAAVPATSSVTNSVNVINPSTQNVDTSTANSTAASVSTRSDQYSHQIEIASTIGSMSQSIATSVADSDSGIDTGSGSHQSASSFADVFAKGLSSTLNRNASDSGTAGNSGASNFNSAYASTFTGIMTSINGSGSGSSTKTDTGNDSESDNSNGNDTDHTNSTESSSLSGGESDSLTDSLSESGSAQGSSNDGYSDRITTTVGNGSTTTATRAIDNGSDSQSLSDHEDDSESSGVTDGTSDTESDSSTDSATQHDNFVDQFNDALLTTVINGVTTAANILHADSGVDRASDNDQSTSSDTTSLSDTTTESDHSTTNDTSTEADSSTDGFRDRTVETIANGVTNTTVTSGDSGSDSQSVSDHEADTDSWSSPTLSATETDSTTDNIDDRDISADTFIDAFTLVTTVSNNITTALQSTSSSSGTDTDTDSNTETDTDVSSPSASETDTSTDTVSDVDTTSDSYSEGFTENQTVVNGVTSTTTTTTDSGSSTDSNSENETDNGSTSTSASGTETGSDTITDQSNSVDNYADSVVSVIAARVANGVTTSANITDTDSGWDSETDSDHGTETDSLTSPTGPDTDTDNFTDSDTSSKTYTDLDVITFTVANGVTSGVESDAHTDSETFTATSTDTGNLTSTTPTDSGTESYSDAFTDSEASSDTQTDNATSYINDNNGVTTQTDTESFVENESDNESDTKNGTENFSGIVESGTAYGGSGSFTDTDGNSETFSNTDTSNIIIDAAGNLNGSDVRTITDVAGWNDLRNDLDNVAPAGGSSESVTLNAQDAGTTTTNDVDTTSYAQGGPTEQDKNVSNTSETANVSESDAGGSSTSTTTNNSIAIARAAFGGAVTSADETGNAPPTKAGSPDDRQSAVFTADQLQNGAVGAGTTGQNAGETEQQQIQEGKSVARGQYKLKEAQVLIQIDIAPPRTLADLDREEYEFLSSLKLSDTEIEAGLRLRWSEQDFFADYLARNGVIFSRPKAEPRIHQTLGVPDPLQSGIDAADKTLQKAAPYIGLATGTAGLVAAYFLILTPGGQAAGVALTFLSADQLRASTSTLFGTPSTTIASTVSRKIAVGIGMNPNTAEADLGAMVIEVIGTGATLEGLSSLQAGITQPAVLARLNPANYKLEVDFHATLNSTPLGNFDLRFSPKQPMTHVSASGLKVTEIDGVAIKWEYKVGAKGERGPGYLKVEVRDGFHRGHVKSVSEGAGINTIDDGRLNIIEQTSTVNLSNIKRFELWRLKNAVGLDVIVERLPNGYIRVKIPAKNIDVIYNPLSDNRFPEEWFLLGGVHN